MPLESFVRFDSSSRRKKGSLISNNFSSSSSPASSALQVHNSCKPDSNSDSLQLSSTLHVSCKKNISMTSSKSSLLSTSSRSNIFRKSFAILLIFAIILKDVNRVVSDTPASLFPSPSSLVFPALASAAVAAAVEDRDSDMRASAEGPDGGTGAAPLLLNLVNPCAIAAAVFGAPAVPYVIPCTILRRIRLFRETLMPESEPQVTSIANLLSNRQKLLLGNLVMGAVSSTATRSGSSGSIRT